MLKVQTLKAISRISQKLTEGKTQDGEFLVVYRFHIDCNIDVILLIPYLVCCNTVIFKWHSTGY